MEEEATRSQNRLSLPFDTELEGEDEGAVVYKVNDVPPWPLSILLGLQHYLTMFGGVVTYPYLLAPHLCIPSGDPARGHLVSTTFLVSGLSTLIQTSIGVRLPIIQGNSLAFLGPSLAVLSERGECPTESELKAARGDNSSHPVTQDEWDAVWMDRMQELQMGLLLAALVEIGVGATGLAGAFSRWLTPLVVAPTVALVGLPLFEVVADSAALNWPVSISTVILLTIFSQYLSNIQIPIPGYNPREKCKVYRFPIFKIFPVVLAIFVVWGTCGILTQTGTLQPGNPARTDLKLDALYEAPWFRIPYPFQWGWPSRVQPGVVAAMTAGILASMVESIGDYHSCARLCGLPPPPGHAISRGLLAEGLGCLLSGAWGTGSGTTSFSENIAAIGITKVASRRVVLIGAAIMMVCGCVGKFGALFVTLPEPLVAGILIVGFSIITAVGLSQLLTVDLSSSRNLLILGLSLFLGLAIPRWTSDHKEDIATGSRSADQILRVLLTTNMLVGGGLGLLLDHTMPGTDRERGLIPRPPPGSKPAPDYDLPICMDWLRSHWFSRYVPFLPTFRQPLDK